MLSAQRIDGIPPVDWMRSSDADWSVLAGHLPPAAAIAPDVGRQIEIRLKYAGYIARQDRQIARFAQMEQKQIPLSVDYAKVVGLRNEARQKLSKFTPHSLGQALRISGITPADVAVLAIHLDRLRA